jgi:Ca2+-transporting ATPase
MVKHNVIIRRLPAVETLGSATIICSDKTGTITKNEMTVQEIWTDNLIKVTGAGYKPEGKFYKNDKEINPLQDKQLFSLLRAGILCNNSELNLTLLGGWEIKGSPSEGALLTLANKAGLKDIRKQHKLLKEISFTSDRKVMTKVFSENNENIIYSKGATEYILRLCKYYNGRKLNKKIVEKILKINEEMASKELYTLALASKKIHKNIDSENIENDLNFLGLVGMSDPIRPEVKDAIKECKQAGIKVVMITGDHLATAKTIAKEIGLNVNNHNIITGAELDALGDEEFAKRSENIVVYARTSHEHKFRIITALQKKGHIVAMTGDGVNDATALKKANIGVSMGIKGSDVAKEASDMVLTDDNFASIVNAVSEGRRIYDNIKKSTLYLLSTALGEVLLIIVGILAGFPLIFFATQILWINLVTEGIPAIGFAFEKEDPDVMKRKPRNPKEKLLSKDILYRTLGQGVLMFIGSMILFMLFFDDLTKARTMAFTTLIMFELFNMFNCRSLKYPLNKMGLFSNKILIIVVGLAFLLQVIVVQTPIIASAFKIIPLNLFEWLISIATGSLILISGEVKKSIRFLNWLPF